MCTSLDCASEKRDLLFPSPLPCATLHVNVFNMLPCESHVACVLCAVSAKQAHVCVSTGELYPFEQITQPSTSKTTMRSFLVQKRVCNTICSLNGARQRVQGSSHISTATILQETTVGVCHHSVSSCCKFYASHEWFSYTMWSDLSLFSVNIMLQLWQEPCSLRTKWHFT